MNALVIGVLIVVILLAINAAIWAAAPFIAIALVLGGIFLLLSKEKKKPDESDHS